LAGVVNVIINKNFTGFKGNVEGPDNYNGDLPTWKAEGAYGTDFDGDRGHFVVSASYQSSPDTLFPLQTNWYKPAALVNNPAYAAGNGQPQFITSPMSVCPRRPSAA
jgi:iron complex outermembrane receptor protein